jgi:hypothetical protein
MSKINEKTFCKQVLSIFLIGILVSFIVLFQLNRHLFTFGTANAESLPFAKYATHSTLDVPFNFSGTSANGYTHTLLLKKQASEMPERKAFAPFVILFGKGLFSFVSAYLNSYLGTYTYLQNRCLRL